MSRLWQFNQRFVDLQVIVIFNNVTFRLRVILFLMVFTWMCFLLFFSFNGIRQLRYPLENCWLENYFPWKGYLLKGHAGMYGMHQNLVIDRMFPMDLFVLSIKESKKHAWHG